MTKPLSKSLGQLVALSLLLLFSQLGLAHSNVVVIPMSGDDLKPLKNIVTVAEANGDFTDPVAAMASITDADIDNRYLLVIAPGVYPLASQLVMKEYVDISGSGRNSTKLSGSISSVNVDSAAGLVVGANHASLRELSLENKNGASTNSIGIYVGSVTDLQLSDLNITVSGGSTQYGVYNTTSSSPTLSDIGITVSDGHPQYGVRNDSSSPNLSNMSITVSGGGIQYGVYNGNSSSPNLSNMSIAVSGGTGGQFGVNSTTTSSPTLSNMNITVSGGSSLNYGVRNSNSSSSMSNMSIMVSDGSAGYGVSNSTSLSSARIRNSAISAPTNSISASTGAAAAETYVSDSILNGTVSGNPVCDFVFFKDTGTALDGSCQEP